MASAYSPILPQGKDRLRIDTQELTNSVLFVFTYQIFKETDKRPSIYNGTVIVAFKELTDSVLSVFTYWIFKETK